MKHRSSVLFCASSLVAAAVTWPGEADADVDPYWRSVNGFACSVIGYTMAWSNPGGYAAQASHVAATPRALQCAVPNDAPYDHTTAASVKVTGYQYTTGVVDVAACVGYYSTVGGRCGATSSDTTHSGGTPYQISPALTYRGSTYSSVYDSPFVSVLLDNTEIASTVQTIYIEYE